MDIAPDKQNLDEVFGNKTYFIDFYQRQYKWTKDPVERLLDDIFYKFNEEYQRYRTLDATEENIKTKYAWYYLNTYVTNQTNGKIFIVDGQQRLTTLTLLLIKLKHMCKRFNSDLEAWVETKIIGRSGRNIDFWMNHVEHKEAMRGLLDGKEMSTIETSSGLTAKNMIANYQIISRWLDNHLQDLHNTESFAFYFLYRLVLINMDVSQTDVPMVFEVINDRGVKLKPYEILKGKLLGQIDKLELETLDLNGLWEEQVNGINRFAEDEIDTFFVYFLKAKFADTIGEGRKFDKDYHRAIFDDGVNEAFRLKHDPQAVKQFLQNEFTYYTNLYLKMLKRYKTNDPAFPHVFMNQLTEMDSQFLLVLSACQLNDPNEDEKVRLVSKEVDRLFCLLQLQNAYYSNDLNIMVYQISAEIRNADIGQIRNVFDRYLVEQLSKVKANEVVDSFSYLYFRDAGIGLEKRFKRYFFARVERFLATETQCEMRHSLNDLVTKTGSVNGFHIEHILSNNPENLELFNNDREKFEAERNRLGGLLLLKGLDNISSSNETYVNKLASYTGSLLWNETLVASNYHSNNGLKNCIRNHALNMRHLSQFGPDELEERQRLLFDISKIIWN